MRGEQWCYVHHPDLADRRAANSRRGGRRGGRGRPASDIAGVKVQLQEMADKVLCGELDRADAAVAGQLLNIKLRCLETERKVLETVELEERLAALEAMAPAQTVHPPDPAWAAAHDIAYGIYLKLFAARNDIDLHRAIELLDQGCPPELAIKILL